MEITYQKEGMKMTKRTKYNIVQLSNIMEAAPLMYEALQRVQKDMEEVGTLHPNTDRIVQKALKAAGKCEVTVIAARASKITS